MSAPEIPESRALYKRLKCGCVKSYPGSGPKRGEDVWCHFHSKMSEVLHTETWVWKGKCTKCKWGRTAHGNIEIGGLAMRHLSRKPDHVVETFDPEGQLKKTYGAGNQGQLSIDDLPPF